MRQRVTRAVVRVPVTIILGLTSTYFFWSAALCETAHVDNLTIDGLEDLDLPFSAAPYKPDVGVLVPFAKVIHPNGMLWNLNDRYYGADVRTLGTPARIPWVRVTVRIALTLAILTAAVLATRLGWFNWQFSLRALFAFVAVAAIVCWAHGQLGDRQQLQPNRDLAWAVGLTLVGMVAGNGAAKIGKRAHGPKRQHEPDAAPPAKSVRLKDLVAGITPENRHAEVDFGPPVGREAW